MNSVPQPTRADESAVSSRWTARPHLARALRLLIWITPIALSLGVFVFASQMFPPETLGISELAWWLIFAVIAFVVLIGADSEMRRLLPLPALLRMALVFPDQAPSRFGAALSSRTATKLGSKNPRSSAALMGLVRSISHHDRATRGHSERVRAYSLLIGEEMKLQQDDLDKLAWSALLHDVGKLDVAPEILNKKGRPNEEEWDALRQHPTHAIGYLTGFDRWMGDWRRAASEHHERWDGSGYPNRLAGEYIHLASRIVSVADSYDVMTSTRSYKKSMPTEAAREEIARNAGSQFDPNVVRAFLNVGIGQVTSKWGALTWATQLPDMASRAPAAVLLLLIGFGSLTGLITPGAITTGDEVLTEVVQVAPTPTPTAVITDSAAGVTGAGDSSGNGAGSDGGPGDGEGTAGGSGEPAGDSGDDANSQESPEPVKTPLPEGELFWLAVNGVEPDPEDESEEPEQGQEDTPADEGSDDPPPNDRPPNDRPANDRPPNDRPGSDSPGSGSADDASSGDETSDDDGSDAPLDPTIAAIFGTPTPAPAKPQPPRPIATPTPTTIFQLPTPNPNATPEPTPQPPTPVPTAVPEPTPVPTPVPTAVPEPTPVPTAVPEVPTPVPTAVPEVPTPVPTAVPEVPTPVPTAVPEVPTPVPTAVPEVPKVPTPVPTAIPEVPKVPTPVPTAVPAP